MASTASRRGRDAAVAEPHVETSFNLDFSRDKGRRRRLVLSFPAKDIGAAGRSRSTAGKDAGRGVLTTAVGASAMQNEGKTG